MARLIAGLSIVLPSPVAPKLRTSWMTGTGVGGPDACALEVDCGTDVSPEAEPIPTAKVPVKKFFLVIPLGDKFPPKSRKRNRASGIRRSRQSLTNPHPACRKRGHNRARYA